MNYQKEKVRKQCHLQLHKKYPGKNLTKKVEDLYTENYKTLMKTNKKYQVSRKIFHK